MSHVEGLLAIKICVITIVPLQPNKPWPTKQNKDWMRNLKEGNHT